MTIEKLIKELRYFIKASLMADVQFEETINSSEISKDAKEKMRAFNEGGLYITELFVEQLDKLEEQHKKEIA